MPRQKSLVLGMLAGFTFASSAMAVPVRYQVNMVAPVDAPAEFSGASIALKIVWNSDLLSPVTDVGSDQRWSTSWWATNTWAEMTVKGSTGRDGSYKNLPLNTIWALHNNYPGRGDAVIFPRLEFAVSGDTISILALEALLTDPYYQELSTLYPKPFSSNEAMWHPPFFETSNPPTLAPATAVTGFAVFIPEPSTLALGSFSLLSLAALRRRK